MERKYERNSLSSLLTRVISHFRLEHTRLGIMDKLSQEPDNQFKKHRISHGIAEDGSIIDSPHTPHGGIVCLCSCRAKSLRLRFFEVSDREPLSVHITS